jgi:hypothetical protein
MWVCAHLGVQILWVNIPELGVSLRRWLAWVGAGVAEPWVQKVASRLRHTRAPWTDVRGAKGRTLDHSSGKLRCPRRTSVALARSSLSDPPTPSHHDLEPKRHFAPLPRAPAWWGRAPCHRAKPKRSSTAQHQTHQRSYQRGICWLVARSNAPFSVSPRCSLCTHRVDLGSGDGLARSDLSCIFFFT